MRYTYWIIIALCYVFLVHNQVKYKADLIRIEKEYEEAIELIENRDRVFKSMLEGSKITVFKEE